MSADCFLHHAAHTTHTGSGSGHGGCVLLLIGYNTLCGEEHAGDAGGVLQSHACNLGGINHAGLKEVLERVGAGVVTIVTLSFANFLQDYGTLDAGVGPI